MIDDNSKKLGRIFMIVLVIIGVIIMIYLVHHTLSVNNYKYELSEGIINRPSDDEIMSFLGELGLNIEDDSVETNELM